MKYFIKMTFILTVIALFASCTPAIINTLSSGLPVVLIDTKNNEPITSKESYVTGTFEILDGTLENSIRVELTQDGFRGRGNTTWKAIKKPYLVKFDSKESLFGMPPHKRWVLLANHFDKSLLRNEFAFTLGNEIYDNLEWTPSSVQVELYINGEYKGVYQLAEDKKVDKNRINIDKKTEEKDFLLEIDYRAQEDDSGEIYFISETYGQIYSVKDPETEETKEYAKQIINDFEAILEGSEFANPTSGYAAYIDIPSFIDWYLVNEITKNKDAKSFSSIYLYYRKSDGKIFMGPIWDFDRSAGVDTIPGLGPEGFHIRLGPWYKRLFEDDTFKDAVRNRWDATKSEVWDAIEDLTIRGRILRRAANSNFTRWNILKENLLPSWRQSETYDGEIESLIAWLRLRYEWLDENL